MGKQHTRRETTPLLARRIDLPGSRVGFTPAPPCPVQFKFLPSGREWSLVALTVPGMPVKVARWLEPFSPSSIHIAPGLAPKVLRAHFKVLPAPWERMLASVAVHYIELDPAGSASIFVEDSAPKVQAFMESIAGDPSAVRERPARTDSPRVKLTARQLQVMSLAVALGYYESPHKLTLKTLGAKLGISFGAVSELLRRGESLIVTSYIDSLSEAKWSEVEDQTAPQGDRAGDDANDENGEGKEDDVSAAARKDPDEGHWVFE